MPYASVADVQALINSSQFMISSTSIPSTITVQGWLDDREMEIEGLLFRCGATVPITGVRDARRLKRYIAEKVAASVWNTAFTDVEEPDFVKEWRKRWDTVIAQAETCMYVLYDQDTQQNVGGEQVTVSYTRRMKKREGGEYGS